MKRNVIRLALTACLCLAICSPALVADSGITVGDFLLRIATAENLHPGDGADAARLLRAGGVNLPVVRPGALLTEGTVAAISRAFGIRVTTSRPDAPFGQDAVDAFMIQFKPEVSGSDQAATGDSGPYPRPNDNAADPRTKGRGKKKGIPPVSGHDPV